MTGSEMAKTYAEVEEVAEEISRGRYMARWYDSSNTLRPVHRTFDTPMGVTSEGVYFIEIAEAQYDDGWEVNKTDIVTWEDIANADSLLADLARREAEGRRKMEEASRAHRREQYERLAREFGDKP